MTPLPPSPKSWITTPNPSIGAYASSYPFDLTLHGLKSCGRSGSGHVGEILNSLANPAGVEAMCPLDRS